MEFNFNRRTPRTVNSLNTTYDYLSIMHYSRYAFGVKRPRTRTRAVTIDTGNLYRFKIGKAKQFSEIDKKQINLMYKCNSSR